MLSPAPDQPKLPVLISYAYLREEPEEKIRECLTRPDVEILLDCGAFTVANTGQDEIELSDYMAFLERWHDHLFGYIALDRLGDPVTTERNLQTMLAQGLKPIPVHVLGDDEARMDELFGYSDWVAFGGLRRPHRGPAPLSYLKAKMAWAKGRNVHWLGYTRARSIATWKPYSVDCSNFTQGSRFGQFDIYLGRGRWVAFEPGSKKTRSKGSLRGSDMPLASNVLARLERWGYRTDELLDESKWRGKESGGNVVKKTIDERRIAGTLAFSFVEYSLDTREVLGTRFFLAASPDQALGIYAALDHVRTVR